MTLWNRFRSWLRATRHRSQLESEMETELGFHLDAYVADLVRAGVSRDEAMRRARLEFGAVERAKEECREARGARFMETLLQDLRFGLRSLRKSPGFTTVAVLTLAIGIGANTAIFSVVYGVLLRPLPFKEPSRLVELNETTPRVGNVSVSYPNFLDWRAQSHAFSEMAAVHEVGFNLAGVSQPENINGEAVTPNYLSMMGFRPFLGRDFDASEEKGGTAPVLLLSYALWQSHLGADPNAVGRTIMLDGRGFTIIGVLPPGYRSLNKCDVMEPIGIWATGNSAATDRGDRGDMTVIGRLASRTTLAQARSEMEGITARLAKEYPGVNDQFGVHLQPLRDAFVGDVRPAIVTLFIAVFLVLLIACANIANLLLVRGAVRTKEIALRIALGAGRGRIVRQMLTENFGLALFGGILGVALAAAGIRGMARLIPADALSGATFGLNGAVLLFVAGLIVVAALVFGTLPALRSTKPDVQSQLKDGGGGTGIGAAQNRLRSVFVVAEISLALVLLAGTGLMIRSLRLLLSVSPGFRPTHVLTMEMDLRTSQYDKDPAIINFWQQLLDRVRVLPGVQYAAVATVVPLTGNHSRTDITVEGMPPLKPGSYPHPDAHDVSSGYVDTLEVPLLRGRSFTDADNESAPHVAMINAMLARQYFPDGDAVGKRIMFGHPSATKPPEWLTIVGVVGDTKLYGLENPSRLEFYVSFRQYAQGHMNLIIKSAVDATALTSSMRNVVASIDKDQPIYGISTMNELLDQSMSTRRFTLILLSLFSGLALALAAIGIYGVIAYSVAQRTRDIGIRVALGATRGHILSEVLGYGVRMTAVGLCFGLAGAFAGTRMLSSLLYGVRSTDTLTFAAVSLVLVCVALLASLLPARRATRIDPLIALRYE